MNSEPSLYGMVFSAVSGRLHLLLPGYWPKRSSISRELQKPKLFVNNTSNIMNNMKSQIKNVTTEVSICGSTNTIVGINFYLPYWKGKIMNNHNKIITLAT